jgi:ABC-2 type transport system ATP-binding protein
LHLLELKNVHSGYDGKEVLHNVNLCISEPSIYVVLGPNGAGKTTLFRTISGIIKPQAGKVLLDGIEVFPSKEIRRKMNYLSHHNALPEEMTVYDALRFYANMEGGNPDEVLDLLKLRDLKNKKISDLSQGQKKKVSIAKVFLREREIYLLDEPTANLDPIVSKEIRDILLELSRDKIVLYSSHNLYEARDVGTYLILIKEGSVALFDRISNIRSSKYRVGIRANTDISKIVDAKVGEGGYYVLSVDTPEEAGLILRDLVNRGVIVTEMRQLDNPLQELFDENGDTSTAT